MAVTIRGAKNQIIQFAASNTPASLMFWGLPGVGKTSAVAQAASELGIGFRAVIAHLYQPTDVLGLPYVWEGQTRYAPPEVFPRVDRDGERGLFFLDEIPNCVQAMQSAWGIVILERSVRKYVFPPGWKIICAGNPPGTRSGSNRLIGPLEGRLTHVTVDPSAQEFFEYAVDRGLARAVIDFIHYEPTALLKYDPAAPVSEMGFPSPRSWERASDVLRMPFRGLRHERDEALRGAIGPKMGSEFIKYLDVHAGTPSIEEVLAGRVKVSDLDARGAEGNMALSAIVGLLLEYVLTHPDQQHLQRALALADGLPERWRRLLARRLWSFHADPSRDIPGAFATMMPEPPVDPGLTL